MLKQKWTQKTRLFVKMILLTSIILFCTGNKTQVFAASKALQGGKTAKSAVSVSVMDKSYTGKISKVGQEVWYKFKAPKYRTWLTLHYSDLRDKNDADFSYTRVYLYDSGLNIVYEDSLWSHKSGHNDGLLTSKNETYYIRFAFDNTRLTYFKLPKFSFLVNMYKDVDLDDMDHATKISLKKTYTRTIAAGEDLDWFSIKIPKSQNYKIIIRNNGFLDWRSLWNALEYELCNSYGECLKYNSNISPHTVKTEKVKLKKNNTYYLKIFTGSAPIKYKLSVVPV